MNGDFTRFSHQPAKHYSRVLRQQGRVDLDADWNEAMEIQATLRRLQTLDLLGDAAAPAHAAGYGVSAPAGAADLVIGAGRLYVGGLLCQLDETMRYSAQPDYPGAPPIEAPGAYLAYLDAWERHVTAAEDPALRDPALGGLDTATRAQTVAQVKLLRLPNGEWDAEARRAWQRIQAPSQGRLSVALRPAAAEPVLRSVDPGGLDNRLYRIEVHDGGQPYHAQAAQRSEGVAWVAVLADREGCADGQARVATAAVGAVAWRPGQWVELAAADDTADGKAGFLARIAGVDEGGRRLAFGAAAAPALATAARVRRVASWKWSRDNGSVVFAATATAGSELELAGWGRDAEQALRPGECVELLDDAGELAGLPGDLCGVEKAIPESSRIVLDRSVAPAVGLRVRRWDQEGGSRPIEAGVAHDLEEGVQATFSGASFRSGDWWAFAARAADRSLRPLHLEAPPAGIQHHTCQLAVVRWSGAAGRLRARVEDRRRRFSPATEAQQRWTATVGDDEGEGEYSSLQAAIDALPGGGTVQIAPGEYELSEPLRVEGVRVRLEAPGGDARIVGAPGKAVVVCRGATGIRVAGLALVSRGGPGLVAEECGDLEVEDCHIRTEDAEADAPGLQAVRCRGVRIRGNRIQAAQAVALAATQALIEGNDLTGTLWVQAGSRDVRVQGNTVHDAAGAGIRLGGGPDGAAASWMPGIRIEGNRILRVRGEAITTGAGMDTLADLIVEGNTIEECLAEAPAAVPGAAIHLRHADGLRLAGNRIRSTGAAAGRPTWAVALACVRAATMADNEALGGGGLVAESVLAAPADATGARPPFSLAVRGNTLVAAGPALRIVGLGPMAIADNELTSSGQPATGALGGCAEVHDVGRDLSWANAALAAASKRKPRTLVRPPPEAGLPDGTVRFSGNRVGWQGLGDTAALALLSAGAIDFQGNEITLGSHAAPAAALLRAPRVHAVGNQQDEGRTAPWAVAALTCTAEANHPTVTVPTPALAAQLAGLAATEAHELEATRHAAAAWLAAIETARASDPEAQAALAGLATDLGRLVPALEAVDTREARRPLPGPHHWVLTGRVTGPIPAGLEARLEPTGWIPAGKQWKRTCPVAPTGDFAFLLSRNEVGWLRPALHVTLHVATGPTFATSRQLRYRNGKSDHIDLARP
jgi:hypothetical protein